MSSSAVLPTLRSFSSDVKIHAVNPPAKTTCFDRWLNRSCQLTCVLFLAGIIVLLVAEFGTVGEQGAEAPATTKTKTKVAFTPSKKPMTSQQPPPPPIPATRANEGAVALGITAYAFVPLLMALCVLYSRFCSQHVVQRRIMGSVAALPIAEVKTGTATHTRVIGRAKTAGTHLIAPISNRPCFWYNAEAWYKKRVGKRTQTVFVAYESTAVDFFLDDGSGTNARIPLGGWFNLSQEERDAEVLVDSETGQLDIETEDVKQKYGGIPDTILRFLRRAVASDGDDAGELAVQRATSSDLTLHYTEQVIVPSKLVAAAGSFQRQSGEVVLSSPSTFGRAPSLKVSDGPIKRKQSSGLLTLFRLLGSATTCVAKLDYMRLGTRAFVSDVRTSMRDSASLVSRAESVDALQASSLEHSVVVDMEASSSSSSEDDDDEEDEDDEAPSPPPLPPVPTTGEQQETVQV